MYCQCKGTDGEMHDTSLDLSKLQSSLRPVIQTSRTLLTTPTLDAAVGTRCGRLSCQGYTHDLGPPLISAEPDSCYVNSKDPSGQKMIAKSTARPDLLYVRRGQVYRQFPSNVTTSAAGPGTVTVIITLTAEPEGAATTGSALVAEDNEADELPPVLTTSRFEK